MIEVVKSFYKLKLHRRLVSNGSMVSRRSKDKSAVAAQVWRRLFDFIIATRSQRQQALARYGLTPNDSRALFSLDEKGRTMRALATEWMCDPSNATWVVDRLEERGFAQRRSDPDDRRVKLVVLTALGAKTKGNLATELYRPPPELVTLGRSDLDALLAATEKLGNRRP
jgi:DNA-binding MarR family transcriptional regulator